MNIGKEIITKFHSIGDAELSLADTQWLIQNIDKAINSAKQACQVEPEVIAKTADTKPIEWITAQYELASDRYMFNEKFILELHTSFWKRLFVKHYTRKHLKEILSSFSI